MERSNDDKKEKGGILDRSTRRKTLKKACKSGTKARGHRRGEAHLLSLAVDGGGGGGVHVKTVIMAGVQQGAGSEVVVKDTKLHSVG